MEISGNLVKADAAPNDAVSNCPSDADADARGVSESSAPQKRVIGAFSATMIVVASMVGTGVFTTTGFLLAETPSAPAVLVA